MMSDLDETGVNELVMPESDYESIKSKLLKALDRISRMQKKLPTTRKKATAATQLEKFESERPYVFPSHPMAKSTAVGRDSKS